MMCVIPGKNTKVFSKAIQSLAKVGSELLIVGTPATLSIRTVNAETSAFSDFKFFPSFFTSYTLSGDPKSNTCMVSVKACIGVFKHNRNMQHCKILMDEENSKLVVQLKHKTEGIVKNHFISATNIDKSMQAVYPKKHVSNKILASHKTLSDISNNFQMNEDEITLEAAAKKLTFKNYVEGSVIDRKFMRSQLTLRPDEFENFSIQNETSVTFSLKEFRALLHFAESINLPLTINFETTGRPVVFILENTELEVILVLSTISPDDISTYDKNSTLKSTAINTDPILSHTITPAVATTSRKRNDVENDKRRKSKKAKLDSDSNFLKDNDDKLFNFNKNHNTVEQSRSIELIRQSFNTAEKEQPLPPSIIVNNFSSKVYEEKHNSTRVANKKVIQPDNETEGRESNEIFVTFKDTIDMDDDQNNCIPASPPPSTNIEKRKSRTIYFRKCFEATFNPKELSPYNQILARNSDTED